jgi:hypothetical protein
MCRCEGSNAPFQTPRGAWRLVAVPSTGLTSGRQAPRVDERFRLARSRARNGNGGARRLILRSTVLAVARHVELERRGAAAACGFIHVRV